MDVNCAESEKTGHFNPVNQTLQRFRTKPKFRFVVCRLNVLMKSRADIWPNAETDVDNTFFVSRNFLEKIEFGIAVNDDEMDLSTNGNLKVGSRLDDVVE